MTVFILALFASACSNTSRNDFAKFQLLNEGLLNSNTIIQAHTFSFYKGIENKLFNPATKQRTLRWYPKVLLIKKYSEESIIFIDSLKNILKVGSQNKNLVGNELYQKLKSYNESVLNVDDEIKSIFKKRFEIVSKSFDSDKHDEKDFTETFSNSTSKIEELALLSKFENNIRIIENETIQFCDYKTDYNDESIKVFSTLIGQSSTHIKAGEILTITAGVGAFCTTCGAKIKINGVLVPVSENGDAIYKFTASGKPGKHTISIKVNGTYNGTPDSTLSNIEYFVVK